MLSKNSQNTRHLSIGRLKINADRCSLCVYLRVLEKLLRLGYSWVRVRNVHLSGLSRGYRSTVFCKDPVWHTREVHGQMGYGQMDHEQIASRTNCKFFTKFQTNRIFYLISSHRFHPILPHRSNRLHIKYQFSNHRYIPAAISTQYVSSFHYS